MLIFKRFQNWYKRKTFSEIKDGIKNCWTFSIVKTITALTVILTYSLLYSASLFLSWYFWGNLNQLLHKASTVVPIAAVTTRNIIFSSIFKFLFSPLHSLSPASPVCWPIRYAWVISVLAALSLLSNDLNLQSQRVGELGFLASFYGIYATYAASFTAAATEAVGAADGTVAKMTVINQFEAKWQATWGVAGRSVSGNVRVITMKTACVANAICTLRKTICVTSRLTQTQ